MRENWARLIAAITAVLVVSLAVVFALIQNLDDPADTALQASPSEIISPLPEQATSTPAELITSGRDVYLSQGCARCHSIAGEGNTSMPLDGVAARHNASELRNWITGDDSLKGIMSARMLSIKQGYQSLPDEQLRALVVYLQSLPARR